MTSPVLGSVQVWPLGERRLGFTPTPSTLGRSPGRQRPILQWRYAMNIELAETLQLVMIAVFVWLILSALWQMRSQKQ